MGRFKNNTIETERLVLEPIAVVDKGRLFEIWRNPDVMKYIYTDGIMPDTVAEKKLFRLIEHWEKHAFGMWMIYLKNTREAIGYGGFRYFEDDREVFKHKIELGYIIDQPYWGGVCQRVRIGLC